MPLVATPWLTPCGPLCQLSEALQSEEMKVLDTPLVANLWLAPPGASGPRCCPTGIWLSIGQVSRKEWPRAPKTVKARMRQPMKAIPKWIWEMASQ